jgi:uncharacterized membrane protein (UPF0182 family)
MTEPPRIVDWPPPRRPRQNRGGLFVMAALAAIVFGGGTVLTYYIESMWFDSLGYVDVFWKTLGVRAAVFSGFAIATFLVLYGSFLLFKPARLGELTGVPILINGQPIQLPVEPVLRLIALGGSLAIAAVTGAGIMANWRTLALYWYGGSGEDPAAAPLLDPIFGRPLEFYLFTLPAWEIITGWVLTLGVLAGAVAGFFVVITSGTRLLSRARATVEAGPWRGLSVALALVLLMLAMRVYLGRFEQLFDDRGGAIFSGVAYTDANIRLTGMLVVAGALVLGAAMALVNAVAAPKLRWLIAAVVPAAVCFFAVGVISSYVNGFIVKPNELVRETPYIAHNIEFTRKAYGLDRFEEQPFPAEPGVEAVDLANNQATIQNIRLWDWRALGDTLRQIQAIRTYYEFPDVDIDRYVIDGTMRQMMVAARELNVERLPETARTWINTKLIYTHGYGVTMNPVNGFTADGHPVLVLSNMPVESTNPSLKVTRPEIYFGQITNTDVYVKTRQQEFNYPQGETNNLTSYEGTGGIVLGGFLRRTLIALDRGDITKLPFSDDIGPESRLLMRRNIRDRIAALAPFLTLDPDPYIVVGEDGRLSWIADGFTTADTFPYARHFVLGRERVNYIRNSVKVVIDAYDGTTTFYVFDSSDPIVAAYQALFPTMFKEASAMPPGLRSHVRYPELLLKLQAAVYGLYHMDSPEVFYNREDLWTVASQVSQGGQGEQATQPMEPNFVLMKLPGEAEPEFIEILPFTPANRNNMIGWIAARSDEPHYGKTIVYNFPTTRLVDGPLQIEARIDQNPQLSAQMALWNQQGSRVLRGSLIVIPVGRALLYAEPIYLQAERSPMPQMRLVVLALQDRLAYGSTFEEALAGLFGSAPSTLPGPLPTTAAGLATIGSPPAGGTPPAPASRGSVEVNALIAEAGRNFSDYQRLTAEGKLAEAGQQLEALKRTLEQLASQRH